ncbi:MAG TPA: M61 family peptidase [Candidatus Eisenbacteria bacterium]|nr:M61 family peptidase [Candidatus Eisenbacteria bacterium]
MRPLRLLPLVVPAALMAAMLCASPARALIVDVDAREAPRKILHAHLTLPVTGGPITLVYPKWLPGEHGPDGPIGDLAGLEFTAGGRRVDWRRDDVEMYAFHVDVPAGARALDVALDFLLPAAGSFSAGVSSTEHLLVLSWNEVVLYPQGSDPNTLRCEASVRLPAGWHWASALEGHEAAGVTRFAPVSLVRLIDSPVLAGLYMREVPLTTDDPRPVFLDMACDSRAGLAIPDATVAHLRRLVTEAGALFGARHYQRYHFLLTLSDHTAHFGLEHHESSDDRVDERTWIDPDKRLTRSGLMPHEYVHSWNGKYRRPAGLATYDYQQPMKGELLWVYEGLTQYLGHVLTARSGLVTPEESRENLAMIAAGLEARPGRTWRPLEDTAVAAQVLYGSSPAWASWRRGTDFYNEGLLIWLETDVEIRRLTHGERSLDDFCHLFHGPPSGPPEVRPYTFDDVVHTLNAVAPHDWAAFLHERLRSTAPHAPLGGIENGGWRLVYRDSMPPVLRAAGMANKRLDLTYSLGFTLDDNGAAIDVIPGSPAARAGIGPGMKVAAVNGDKYSHEVLMDAVKASRTEPIELLMDNGDFYSTHRLDYHGGPRYPWLERIPGREDVLARIITPRVGAVDGR